VAQFVPLKVETDGDDWQQWASKYRPEGNSIPILYVIRADGQMLYGKSGAKEGAELPRFLTEHLGNAGKIFSDQQLQTIRSAVEESNKALTDNDPLAAVKRMEALRKLGTPGKLGSYATAALEADSLYARLVEQGRTALKTSQEGLAADDKFMGVLGVVSANRIYGPLPELRKDLVAAERDLGKNAELKDSLKQADALDKALALAGQKGTSQRKSGIAALGQVIARFPDGPAAKIAQAKLTELGVEPAPISKTAGQPSTALRKWTDITGKFKIEAELVSLTDGNVQLKKKDGSLVSVPLDKLSQADREFIATDKK
jgi:SLA1 Homology Domain 1 (SHD1) protein